VLLLLLWSCGDDGTETTTEDPTTSTTTTSAPTVTTPAAPVRLTSELLEPTLPWPQYGTTAASVGDTIVIGGGLDGEKSSTPVVWRFDPATGETRNIARLPSETRDAAVGAIGDTVVIAGGAKGQTTFDRVVTVDLEGVFGEEGKLPAPRADGWAVTAPDGATVYVLGGYDGSQPTNEVLATTDGRTFSAVATMPVPLRNATAAMLGRSIWVVGGDWSDQEQTGVYRIDLDATVGPDGATSAPAGNVVQVATLPAPLTRAAAFTLGGSIFVAGGRSGGAPTDRILRIDALSGTVADAGTLPVPTSDAMVGVVGETAYLLGGQSPDASKAIVALRAA